MGSVVTLEDFDRLQPGPDTAAAAPQLGAVDLEEERLKAFEKGYGAGWDDAARAHSEEQDAIAADLGRALQDMSFTYHEAQSALMQEVGRVLTGLVDTVLPEALHPALSALIRDRAMEAVRAAGVRAEIVVAPDNVERVSKAVQGKPAPPLRVIGEPSLGTGQAFLRFGAAEEKIDLDGVLDDLRAAVARFAAPRGEGDGGAVPESAGPPGDRLGMDEAGARREEAYG